MNNTNYIGITVINTVQCPKTMFCCYLFVYVYVIESAVAQLIKGLI